MNTRTKSQKVLTLENCFTDLQNAIQELGTKLGKPGEHELGREPCTAYDAATNGLGRAISVWSAQLPGFREQLSLWLNSHQGD